MGGNVQDWESKITWDAGADPITEAEYSAILQKIFPEAWSSAAIDFHYTLKARHFIYAHSGPGEPHFHNGIMTQQSDCGGGATNFGSTASQLKTLGTIHASLLAIPGIGQLGQLVLAPLDFILAHHAKAIALEQHDICGATVGGNAMLDDIDSQFYADMITEAQAVQGLQNLGDGLRRALSAVTTASGRTKGSCNAACATMLYFDGLVELRKSYLYPAHSTGIASKILPPVASQAISTAGLGVSSFVGTLTGGSVKLSSNVGFLVLLLLLGMVAMAASRKGVIHA